MFKYFTFKGILCSLKKFIVPAVVGVIVFALLGAGFAFSKAESDESGEITFSVEYTASRAFLISLPDGESQTDLIEAELATAPIVTNILGNAACRAAVLEALIEIYEGEEAPDETDAENTEAAETTAGDKKEPSLAELFGKKKGDELEHGDLGGYLTTAIASGTPMITLSVTAKDEEFAENILACYSEYLCTTAMEFVGSGATCTPLGEAVVDSHVSGGMQSITPEGSVYEAMMKYAIIFGFVGAVVAALGIVIVEFFKPTMVDAEDFAEYGVKLYGESCTAKKQKMSFAEDALIRDLEEKGYESVAVIGSLTGERAEATRAELAKRISELSGVKVTHVGDVLSDFSCFEAAKATDAVILVERKGKTDRVRFEKLVCLLDDYAVSVIGGVSL